MKQASYEEKLGTDPILPLIFKMALPAVAAQLVNLLYSIVDRVYIGHIPEIGTNALAGVGVTSSLLILISAFSQIVGGGGAPLASIALGGGDRARAEKILGNGFTLLILFAFFTNGVAYLFGEPILLLTGASEDTIGYALDYLRIYLIGTLFVMIATGMNSFINAQGRPGIAMCSVLIGAALNIILDPILIFSFGLGVKGAAIATVISQGCSAAFVLGFLLSGKATLRIIPSRMKLSGKTVGSIFSLGISPFVMASTESLVGFVLNSGLSAFGDIYVSSLTVMQSAMHLVSTPLTGFANGFVPVISYNYGHHNLDRVRKGFRVVLTVMFSFNFLLTLLMILFPSYVAGIFTDETALIAVVAEYMPVFLLGMTIFGLQRACQNMFIALGQAKVSLFIALLRKIILLIPLALILPRFFNVLGIYMAEAIADGLAAISCTAIFAFSFPRILKKAESSQP